MKKNENGRSMVEMLGVLAIIGVLSIGGIAGYTRAMQKHRINELSQAISMTMVQALIDEAAVTYSTAFNEGDEISIAGVTDITYTPDSTDAKKGSVAFTGTWKYKCADLPTKFGNVEVEYDCTDPE